MLGWRRIDAKSLNCLEDASESCFLSFRNEIMVKLDSVVKLSNLVSLVPERRVKLVVDI